jgi:putative DNA primase/helicase
MNIKIAETNAHNLKDYFISKDGKKAAVKKGIFEIAKHITENFYCLALGDFKRDIFIYDEGVYKLATNAIKEYVQSIMEETYSIGWFNEIIEQIKNRCTKEREEIEMNNREMVNVNNGILDVHTYNLIPHDPQKYYFFNKISINYNAGATCPNIERFLKEILEPKNIDLIQEMFGFCLYRQYFIKKAFILAGEKNTGKTTLVKILIAMLGKNNVCGISLQDLGVRHFAIADLYNKYANIYDDMSSEDITNTGKFKMVTGQSPIIGEYKYGDRFPFINYAKLVFACNKIPAVNDVDDEAYFDRWILINFKNVIEKDKIDPFLLEKLINEQEMSGLFNFAIDGLRRLIEQKWFSYNKNPEQIKQEMLQNSNPIASFIYNCCVRVEYPEFSYIEKNKLYDYYGEYCDHKNLNPEGVEKFNRDILKYAPYVREYRPQVETFRPWCWKNIKVIIENI